MRTATKNTFTDEQIREAVRRHFPGAAVTKITMLRGGTFNTLYRIDGTSELTHGMILKTGPSKTVLVAEHEKNNIRTEVETYRLVGGLGLPVPKIYACDFSRKFLPSDFFFMEYIEGKSWYELWTVRNPALMRELGRCTAKIHSVKGGWFGEIGAEGEDRYTTWGEAFQAMTSDALSELQNRGKKLPYRKISEAVASRRNLLGCLERPSLVNFDLWAGNIFLKRKREYAISAIIDFERSLFADPLLSFVSAMFLYENVEKERDFIEGYNEVSNTPLHISPADREKMILYELFFYLRAFCEVERYGTFLRVTESFGISGMIDYCLRRLEKLPMHKYNNREEKLTYETHNNKP